jgi:hypothetical protein
MESLLAIAFAEELHKATNAEVLETFKRINHWALQIGYTEFREMVCHSYELMDAGTMAADQAVFFASEAC